MTPAGCTLTAWSLIPQRTPQTFRGRIHRSIGVYRGRVWPKVIAPVFYFIRANPHSVFRGSNSPSSHEKQAQTCSRKKQSKVDAALCLRSESDPLVYLVLVLCTFQVTHGPGQFSCNTTTNRTLQLHVMLSVSVFPRVFQAAVANEGTTGAWLRRHASLAEQSGHSWRSRMVHKDTLSFCLLHSSIRRV